MSIEKDLQRIHFIFNYSQTKSLMENNNNNLFNKRLIIEEYPYSDLKNNPTAELIAKVIKDSWGTVNDYEAWAEAAFASIWTKEMHDNVASELGIQYPQRVIDYIRKFMTDSELKRKFRTKPIWDHEQYLLGLEKKVGNYGAGKKYPYNLLQDDPSAINIYNVLQEAKGTYMFSNDKEAWAEAAFNAIDTAEKHRDVLAYFNYKPPARVINFIKLFMSNSELKTKYFVKPIWEHEQELLRLESILVAKEEKEREKFHQENPDMVWNPDKEVRKALIQKAGSPIPVWYGAWEEITPQNIGKLRATPLGFSEEEYPEYLRKRESLIKKYSNNTKFLEAELERLKKEYYDPKFWKGSTQKDRDLYYQSVENIKKDMADEISAEWTRIRGGSNLALNDPNKIVGISGGKQYTQSEWDMRIFNKWKEDPRYSVGPINSKLYSAALGIEEKYDNYIRFINIVFGYDPTVIEELEKGWFEKFWEKNGIWAELIVYLALDALTEGYFAVLAQDRNMKVLAAVLKVINRSIFPISAGLIRYFNAGYLTDAAVMDFVFAVLPWAHDVFKVSKTTEEVCENIIRLRRQYNLQNLDEAQAFMKALSNEERRIFREVAAIPKENLEAGLEQIWKKVQKIHKQTIKTTGNYIRPSIRLSLKELAKRMALVDFPILEMSKYLASKFGFLKDQEKQNAIVAEFKKVQGQQKIILAANFLSVLTKYPQITTSQMVAEALKYEIKDFESAVDKFEKSNALFEAPMEWPDGTPVTDDYFQ